MLQFVETSMSSRRLWDHFDTNDDYACMWFHRFDKGTKELVAAVNNIAMTRLRENKKMDVMSGECPEIPVRCGTLWHSATRALEYNEHVNQVWHSVTFGNWLTCSLYSRATQTHAHIPNECTAGCRGWEAAHYRWDAWPVLVGVLLACPQLVCSCASSSFSQRL